MVSDAILCPLHNLNTLWYITRILHSYKEQIITICRIRMTTLAFILSELSSLDGLAVISCPFSILNAIRNIFMRLHSFVEEVVTICHV